MTRHVSFLSVLACLALWVVSSLALVPSASAVAPAVLPAEHGLHSLRGPHGFTYSGSVAGLGPVASSGRIDFDGFGGVDAVFTTSVAGHAFTGSFQGTYSVNADGTGSIVLDLPWLGVQAGGDFVIVEHGAGTFFTATDGRYSVTGSTKRM